VVFESKMRRLTCRRRARLDVMRMTLFLFFAVPLLASGLRAQAPASDLREEPPQANIADGLPNFPQEKPAQVPTGQEEEHRRLFWIIPTYTVSNTKSPVSLSSHQKFRLFLKNTSDPYTIVTTALSAGVQQADNGLPGYGQGAAGYGKRLGAGLADEASSGFFKTYLFPSLFHEDPRYFRMGSGPFKSRLAHAVVRSVVTRHDSGGHTFNWSGVLGRIASSSLSDAYYPTTDRGADRIFKRVGIGMAFGVIGNFFDEFGPDIEKKLLGRK